MSRSEGLDDPLLAGGLRAGTLGRLLRFCGAGALVMVLIAIANASARVEASSASADGLIAFTRAGSIYIVSPDGTGLRKLAETRKSRDSDYALRDPSWSPEGDRIAYLQGDRGSIVELWVRRSDGSGARQLAINAEYVYEPVTWSRDGKSLAFTRIEFADGNPWIFRSRLDGLYERTLTRRHMDEDPAWSPDGGVVAFARGTDFSDGPTIYLVRSSGRGPLSRVTAGREPDWSPDGRLLAFVREGDIYTSERDGTDLRRITRSSVKESSPEWGPGGTSLAFVRTGAVWVVGADGQNERRVVGGVPSWGTIDWQQRVSP